MKGHLEAVIEQQREEFGVSDVIPVTMIRTCKKEGVWLLLTRAPAHHCRMLNWPWSKSVSRWEKFASLSLVRR
jgi:hypothetical protein